MTRKPKDDDEMRSHYDFSGGVRGKYAARYAELTPTIEIHANGVLVGCSTISVIDDETSVGSEDRDDNE